MKDQGVFWKTIRRLAAQSAVPFLISVAYAAWVYINKGEKAHATDAISAFGASFFFLMWLVGQFFRASKQLADSDSFSRLSAGIDDINKSIRELKEAPATGSAQTANAGTTPSNQLMFQAKQLVQNGHVLAGLLQAGVAFEQAVLAKAHRMGLDRQNFRSVPHLLAQIEDQLGLARAKNYSHFGSYVIKSSTQTLKRPTSCRSIPSWLTTLMSASRCSGQIEMPSNNSFKPTPLRGAA